MAKSDANSVSPEVALDGRDLRPAGSAAESAT